MENLNRLRDEAFETAKAHGWHDGKMPDEHWLCLAASELMEAVDADRKGRYADLQGYLDDVAEYPTYACEFFEKYIKDTVEDELADAAIRLLDWAGLKGYDVRLDGRSGLTDDFKSRTFTLGIYSLVQAMVFPFGEDVKKNVAGTSIKYIRLFAESRGIDLMTFIELKMEYNKNRPYRHNNLKY